MHCETFDLVCLGVLILTRVWACRLGRSARLSLRRRRRNGRAPAGRPRNLPAGKSQLRTPQAWRSQPQHQGDAPRAWT